MRGNHIISMVNVDTRDTVLELRQKQALIYMEINHDRNCLLKVQLILSQS